MESFTMSSNGRSTGNNFLLFMELRKKITIFRDIFDIPPLNGSVPTHELMISTAEDLHRMYPEFVSYVPIEKLKERNMYQGLICFYEALKCIGDLEWMEDTKVKEKFSYDNVENVSMEELAKIVMSTLDNINKATKGRFDITEEDKSKKDYSSTTMPINMQSVCCSPKCKYPTIISPQTPTSMLPESPHDGEYGRYSPPHVWGLRVRVVGRLTPMDLNRLSLHMILQNNIHNQKIKGSGDSKNDEKGALQVRTGDDMNQEDGEDEVKIEEGTSLGQTLMTMEAEYEDETLVPPSTLEFGSEGAKVEDLSLSTLDYAQLQSQDLTALPPPITSVIMLPSSTHLKLIKTTHSTPPPPPIDTLPHTPLPYPTNVIPLFSTLPIPRPPPPPPPPRVASPPPPPPNGFTPSKPSPPPPPPPPIRIGPPPPPPPPPLSSIDLNGGVVGPSSITPLWKGQAPPLPLSNRSLRVKTTSKLKRSSHMGNLYRLLKGKVEGSSSKGKSSHEKKDIGSSNSGGGQCMDDALAEMTKRSVYFQRIEQDVEKYGNVIKEMEAVLNSFQTKDMDELLKFHKQVESKLEVLTDESLTLSRFESFPVKKLEALRMAAALYIKLSGISSKLQNWQVECPLGQLLDRVEKYFNKIKGEVETLERIKDEESKKFQSHNIQFDFGILIKIKEAIVDVSSSCMELALKERREAKANDQNWSKPGGRKKVCAKMLWRAFQLAFKVYSFAGGQDEHADTLTRELAKEIETDPMQD